MSSRPIEHAGAAAWQPQELRLTVFPLDPAAAIERDWWQAAFGQEAETSTKKKLLRTEEGVIEGKAVGVVVDPQRISLTVQPAIDPLNLPSLPPTLGPLGEALENMGELFEKMLACLPDVRRIAFGAVLQQSADSHEAAYRRLDSYLPDVQVSPETSEFLYRINRRRASQTGIADLSINRLTTWSVIRWHMQIEVGLIGIAGSQKLGNEGFCCKLDLDINTDAERESPLPKNQHGAVWAELLTLGAEIADKGDIP